MSLDHLKTNADGNIILNPVMGWVTAPVGDIAVLLAIEYADTPEGIQKGGKQIQLVLTPPQCLELAEMLTKKAKAILEPPTGQAPM